MFDLFHDFFGKMYFRQFKGIDGQQIELEKVAWKRQLGSLVLYIPSRLFTLFFNLKQPKKT